MNSQEPKKIIPKGKQLVNPLKVLSRPYAKL